MTRIVTVFPNRRRRSTRICHFFCSSTVSPRRPQNQYPSISIPFQIVEQYQLDRQLVTRITLEFGLYGDLLPYTQVHRERELMLRLNCLEKGNFTSCLNNHTAQEGRAN